MGQVREELVRQGVRFLQHPQVQDTPLSDRLKFLEKKGLTSDEIAQAMRQHDEAVAKKASQAVESATSASSGNRLKDRVGIVFGGTTGLGHIIALRLASEGAKVTIAGPASSENKETLAQLEKAAEDASEKNVSLEEGDLASPAFLETVVQSAVSAHKRLDFTINCIPSDTPPSSLMTTTEKQWDAAMGIAPKATFFACKFALKQFLQQDISDQTGIRGRIVNVSSLYGMIAHPNQFTFGVSKSAIVHLTRQIAAEYASQRIVCNAVAPGSIDDSTSKQDCIQAASQTRTPAGESGKALDVANAVVFLTSDETRYIHGVNLLVDGGSLAT